MPPCSCVVEFQTRVPRKPPSVLVPSKVDLQKSPPSHVKTWSPRHKPKTRERIWKETRPAPTMLAPPWENTAQPIAWRGGAAKRKKASSWHAQGVQQCSTTLPPNETSRKHVSAKGPHFRTHTHFQNAGGWWSAASAMVCLPRGQ